MQKLKLNDNFCRKYVQRVVPKYRTNCVFACMCFCSWLALKIFHKAAVIKLVWFLSLLHEWGIRTHHSHIYATCFSIRWWKFWCVFHWSFANPGEVKARDRKRWPSFRSERLLNFLGWQRKNQKLLYLPRWWHRDSVYGCLIIKRARFQSTLIVLLIIKHKSI